MSWPLAHPLAVAVGGAAGALLRYAINTAFIRHGFGGLLFSLDNSGFGR
ncbi:MAG: hypothetical protein LC715_06825 [Gammaproteobacteria bacterium]|nr:hypothetical protein [Gammaproteobacteria bacterium]